MRLGREQERFPVLLDMYQRFRIQLGVLMEQAQLKFLEIPTAMH